MDGVIVKHFYGGGNGGDDRCRLSVLSRKDLSPKVACVNLSLPSYIDDKHITCGSCCGLFYFVDFEGNIVLCNLTTKHLKPLPPPPKVKPRFKLFASGLGYDSKSDDFKVIRFLGQPYYKGSLFKGYKDRWQLYSLKSGVWKDVPTPDANVSPDCGVYIGGSCYWRATLGISFGDSSIKNGFDILSFDFTTESFHCLHSPPHSSNTGFDLVEYRGSLGAFGFSRSDDATRGFGFEFWLREESSWAKVFDVVLFNVERLPLGLIDGRFLFLERKCRSNELLNQLVVYDQITKEWKELDIYDYHEHMEVSFYVEGQVALPDAMPMQRSYTQEEEKQIKKRRRERCNDWSDDDDEDDDASGESCKSTDDEDEDDYRSGDSSGESCKSTDDEDEDDYRSGDSSGESCKSTDDEDGDDHRSGDSSGELCKGTNDEDEEDDDMIDDDDDDTSMIIDDDNDDDDDDDD